MPRKSKATTTDVLSGIASGLRTAAVRPNVFGYEPMPKQQTFHESTAKGRLFLGGNRSGKTVAGAVEAVRWLMGSHPDYKVPDVPIRARCVSTDFLHGVEKIVKPEIARWLPLSALKNGSWEDSYSKEFKTLTLENGSFLEFMSYDQDLEKFAGTSRHFIWFDEEPPEAIYKECLARLIDTGGHWWITMTPVEGMTWVFDQVYVRGKIDPNIFVVEVDMTENIYLNPAEIDLFTSNLDRDERKARIQGRFVQMAGVIYKTFSERHIIDPFFPDPSSHLHFAMMDHGFNNPTAWLWGAVDNDGQVFIYDEHYQSGLIVAQHADVVKLKNREHGVDPSYNVGDPSIVQTNPITGTSVQIEYMENGIPIAQGNNDVKAGIDKVASYLRGTNDRPKLYIMKKCEKLIWEMARYRWGTWSTAKMRAGKNVKEEPHKQNDHACDALRYGLASRPSFDQGKFIPETPIQGIAPRAVDPYHGRIDRSLVSSEKPYADYTLGSEY